MADGKDILVFSENSALLAELVAAGKLLAGETGGSVIALIPGPPSAAQEMLRMGAEQAAALREGPAEECVPTLAQLVEDRKPFAVLVGATTRGRAVAGRLGARLGISAVTDVRAMSFEAGQLQAQHLIFGGGAMRVDRPLSEVILITIGSGVYQAQSPSPSETGEIIEVPWVEPDWKLTVLESRPRPVSNVNLAAARRVVCPGRGVAKKEDLTLIQELAQSLSAEVGCTRPLAEGLDWLPRERYIGISGAHIKPDLYLGVGVSGQAQHMIGMGDSRVVAAINKDKDAPIFSQADYGIVGDLYEVVPALIRVLKARK